MGQDVAILETPYVVSYTLKGAAAPHPNEQARVSAFALSPLTNTPRAPRMPMLRAAPHRHASHSNLMTPRLLSLIILACTATLGLHAQSPLTLKKGDHIAIVGSGLADRQQHHGWLESLIHKAYPDYQLVVRNLGFAADEVNLHPRSDEVPTIDFFLNMKPGALTTKAGNVDIVYHAGTDFHANVILAYWGFNESFKGEAGLADFKKALDEYLKATLAADYGQGHPRVVLLSPIAHENLKSADFPDGSATHKNLTAYTAAMAEVAKANRVAFVDLLAASQALYSKAAKPLTINGIHLTTEGDKTLAPVQFAAIFGKEAPSTDDPYIGKIRDAVLEKNVQWHHRYRTVDQFNIFGQRSRIKYEGVDNATILGQELAQRDVKVANRDKAVWAAAEGKDFSIKDDNLPPVELTPVNRKEAVPYLKSEDQLPLIKVPEGCKVELVADETTFPELINPVQMNFDTKGRLWVAAWPTYPETMPTTTNFDKLIVFDLDPKTGKAIKCTTFLDGLNCPTGFQFYKDGVIVMQSPDLWFVRDTDGDGKADWKERVLHGLDAADSHHETNSICYEPGGAIYLSDGVFHRTNVETYNGPVRNVNGAIYRFEPRTSKFERYIPYGFANPHGRVFDDWGNDIITDATGNANYFGPGFSGHLDSGSHGSYPQFWQRPSRPCPGTNILSSRHFPDDWQGQFLNTNVISFQGIFRAKITEQGSGLLGETIEPLVDTDIAKNPNFRPSGIATAPDGSLYFMDWSQMLIGHLQHHLRDPNRDHQHGRLYRITYPSRDLLKPAKIAGEPIAVLLDLLKSPELDTRRLAKIELDTHDSAEVIAATQKWVKQFDITKAGDIHHILEALWVHQWHNAVNADLINALLKCSDHRARAQAVRVICYQRDRIPNALDLLKTAVNDTHPRVRLEAIRAASFFNGADTAKAIDIAFDSLKHEGDQYIDYCFKETMKQLQSLSKDKILPTDPAVLATLLSKMEDGELNGQPKTQAVLEAKLERKSYDIINRTNVITELAKLHKTDKVSESLAQLARLDSKGNGMSAAATELGKVLVTSTPAELSKSKDALTALAAKASIRPVRKAAWAGIVIADGKADAAWAATQQGLSREALVQAISIIPDIALRAQFQSHLVALAPKEQGPTLQAILTALPLMGPANADANFAILAKHVIEGKERNTAADALLQLPRASWKKDQAAAVAQSILAYAKTVPADKRSQQSFVELNQLGIEMASLADDAALRKELRGLGVAVFVVKTVHEQLRFDTQRLVVEKGKPFEIIFENSDVMPHNLVIVDPDKHAEIGTAAMTMGPNDKDKQGRTYLPKGQKFIEATKLLEPGQKETLKVKAPGREGEYEFVCTFPGHWMIMWGKLIVTKDVDGYLAKNPTFTLPPMTMPPATK